MQISFFEEFPTKKNLEKLKLINWPAKLYFAARSLNEFEKIKSKITNKKIKEYIYWPILKKKEGYWVSPFSKRKALLRIFDELKNRRTAVMLDLELPTTKNPFLYLTQLFNFKRNKTLISNFINDYKGIIYLAEYYPEGQRKDKILELLGLHYHNKKLKIIKMLYHSLHNFKEEFIKEELKRGKADHKNNFLVALGTIAQGINKNERLLPAEQLKKDLRLAKKAGINEVIIFRLGGLDHKYIKIMKGLF